MISAIDGLFWSAVFDRRLLEMFDSCSIIDPVGVDSLWYAVCWTFFWFVDFKGVHRRYPIEI